MVDGIIIAGDVAKGSPAEEGGLKEGDEIVSINRNFSNNLTQYKHAMQAINERVKMIVRRKGQLVEIEFRAKSILSR